MSTARLPAEWDAYFPAAILLVDRPRIVDLFVEAGAHVHARIAIVCVDGSPAHVVDWLCRGLRAGRRAPLGFLHDASAVVYPFAFEPLATMLALGRAHGEALPYCDLGLPREGLPNSAFPFADARPSDARVLELATLRPCSLLGYATRRLLSLLPGDPMMAPLRAKRRRFTLRRASEGDRHARRP